MVGRVATTASAVRGHRDSVAPRRLGDGNNLAPMLPSFIRSGAPGFRFETRRLANSSLAVCLFSRVSAGVFGRTRRGRSVARTCAARFEAGLRESDPRPINSHTLLDEVVAGDAAQFARFDEGADHTPSIQ